MGKGKKSLKKKKKELKFLEQREGLSEKDGF